MPGPIDTTAEIETPEHVLFRHRVAGPTRRVLAYLVDFALRGAVVATLYLLVTYAGLIGGEQLASLSFGMLLVVRFLVEWLYYVLCEALMNGQSPGKALLRIRVISVSGQPLVLVDSMLRNLLRAADFLPALYALGLIVMIRDGRFRRIGDLVAGTMVVVEERHGVTQPLRIEPAPTARELRALPERVPLSADELDAIELFLRRLGALAPAREVELAEMIAPTYARRLGLHVKDPVRFLALLYHRARGEKL